MIRPGKVRTVASFEFLTTVRRKAYVITTFGMPLFVLMYIGLFALIGVATEKKGKSEVRVFGVVDGAGILQGLFPGGVGRFFEMLRGNPMMGLLGLLLAWKLFGYVIDPAFSMLLGLLHPGEIYS